MLEDIISSIKKESNGKSRIEVFEATQIGFAKQVLMDFSDVIRYIKETEDWRIWKDSRWVHIESLIPMIDETRKKYLMDINKETDKDIVKRHYSIYKSSGGMGFVKGVIEFLEEFLSTSIIDWDNDTGIIACKNGYFDVETCTFHSEYKPEMYITRILNIEYEIHAKCPKWEKFMNEALNRDGNDSDVVEYMQKVFGYSITDDTSVQKWWILYGTGQNGKSTMMSTLREIFKEYSESLEPTSLEQRSGIRADLAVLKEARLVTVDEPDENTNMSTGLIKRISGEDRLTVEFKYKNPFSFKPKFKIFLITNHKPNFSDVSRGHKRKLVIVEFKYVMEGKKRLSEMVKEFETEKSGILNWMIEGIRKWRKYGIVEPDKIARAINKYHISENMIQEFLTSTKYVEDTEVTDLSASTLYRPVGEYEIPTIPLDFNDVIRKGIESPQLYHSFKKWSIDNGYKPISCKTFTKRCEQMGYKKEREGSKNSQRYYIIGEPFEEE